ncbi:lytic transglycosylase domain-containing protein [Acetobacter estunensis]|uniref:lytic transglycosylase domain-containing protein n=1 Tax=Acetobacter estunensis TaxID=104097 RepID=UPI001F5542BC|nr:lytic transglycosylase domain-containing protein [Acetobacter estunensis]
MCRNGERRILRILSVGGLLALAACSATSRPGGDPSQWGRGNYTPPGTTSDPWGPYVREASGRFQLPEQWIRAVMNQESGGKEYRNGRLTRSGAGAIGLMQLMPSTWSSLAAQYGLGNDPYEPHDNITAGSGYIRQLYDRFGSPGFLAAYNAGPGRLEQYLQAGTPLPDETVNYVASISPHLGDTVPAVGATPVMVASASQRVPTVPTASVVPVETATLSRTADGCLRNVDAAYDPSDCLVDRDVPHADPAPLPPPQPTITVASTQPLPAPQPAPLPTELASYVEPVGHRAPVMQASYAPVRGMGGSWAVQVGAFSSGGEARMALAQARAIIGPLSASPLVMRVPSSAAPLYRARLVGLGAEDAAAACRALRSHAMACFRVPIAT